METLFEFHLWDMLSRLHTEVRVTELLLDAYRGRERRISLYNQISQRPLKAVLEAAELSDFLPAWKRLAEARNRTVHGEWQGGYDLDIPTIEYVRDNCYDALAAMHEAARQARASNRSVTPSTPE